VNLLLATAVHIVVLVSGVVVPAFPAIELGPRPTFGAKLIVTIPTIEDILAIALIAIIAMI